MSYCVSESSSRTKTRVLSQILASSWLFKPPRKAALDKFGGAQGVLEAQLGGRLGYSKGEVAQVVDIHKQLKGRDGRTGNCSGSPS